MTALRDFSFITELIDDICLIDENANLTFMGSALKQQLSEFHIDPDLLKEKSLLQTKENTSFNELIHSVLNNRFPGTLRPGLSNTEFIAVPFSGGLIFGLKETITRIAKIENDLKERVKELECLYNISKEYDSEKSLDEFLKKCPSLIEKAFQYPDKTIVNIELGKRVFGNNAGNPADIEDHICSSIDLDGVKKGEIRVFIKSSAGILEEELMMIDEISNKISRIIEKEEETRYLEKQKKILTAKNEALLKVTEECYQKRENLRTFFNAISDKIVVIDRSFNILMSNKDELGDSGYCYKKIFGFDRMCNGCPAVESFNSGRDSSFELQQDERFYQLRTHPIFGTENKVDRVLEVCRDITEQKNLEAQLIQSYKLASLGKLVAGVAHEINNPNTFILGNLNIIDEAFRDIFPILDNYYSEHPELKIARLNYNVFKDNITVLVNDMINGANRTKKIVGDLRNFAKKDDGAITELVDLNDVIKNNLTLTKKHIKKFASLETELKEGLPPFAGSIPKIEQVLLNITMNASEAIESGEGIIKIKTGYDEKNHEVLLIVSDNGCGMDESVIKNIFDPFFTTKRNKGGTGLGLSITYGIIKDHKGKIEVSSKPGAGTVFTVRFPAAK